MGQQSERYGRPTRVVLIEDDEDVRALIEVMIEVDDRFELVGQAGDGMSGVALACREQPHVVILDLELPELDGVAAIPELRQHLPRTSVVVFSAFPDPFTLEEVLRLGADAYVDKGAAWAELLPAISALRELETTASA